MDTSFTEENYLKAIYHLCGKDNGQANTNRIAAILNTKAASVTDMIKKLSAKNLIDYERYQGVSLTEEGKIIALKIIRKHRLWEFFLVEKLAFGWDEVHELAEQLEHIQSTKLINRLDEFLAFPATDPHGDPIPDQHGKIKNTPVKTVSNLKLGDAGTISGVKEHSAAFLQYLEKMNLVIGRKICVEEIIAFDETVVIRLENSEKLNISKAAAKNILINNEQL